MAPNPIPGDGKMFISYARKDVSFALKLTADLEDAGVPIQREPFRFGFGRMPATSRVGNLSLVDKCQQLLFVISPEAIASSAVKCEVYYALKKKKAVIAALVRDADVPTNSLEWTASIFGETTTKASRSYWLAATKRTPKVSPEPRTAFRSFRRQLLW